MSMLYLPFLDVFTDASGGNIKTLTSEFLEDGKIPVIDQGQSLIAGYVNDQTRICKALPPVIVFGDHTKAIKYVDFPFAMGADGTKVLVPKNGAHAKYLFYALRTVHIPDAGYSRHYKFLKETTIPLPPLAEQKRIAAILDAADALRAKRREALAQLDALLQSTFLTLFGDPVTNPMEWPEVQFETIVESTKLGLVRGSTEFGWGMPIPYVRMDAITNDGQLLAEKVQGTNASREELEAFGLRAGDFLLNTRNSKELVGKIAVFRGPQDWTFNNNIIRIRFFRDVEPDVISTQFRFARVKQALENRKARTTNVFAIYWKDLKTLPVLLPPIPLQQHFANIVKSIEHQKATQRAHLAELDALFASLQHRAFRGKL